MLVKALIVFAALSVSLSSGAFNRTEALNCLKSCKKTCTESSAKKATQNRGELIECLKTCHSDQCVKK